MKPRVSSRRKIIKIGTKTTGIKTKKIQVKNYQCRIYGYQNNNRMLHTRCANTLDDLDKVDNSLKDSNFHTH